MILLQADSSLTFGGIPITDWIQAVGALVAVIGAFWAFITLFLKDKDKQKQIDSLTSMALESRNQTEQLIEQSRHMERSNNLFAEQINILQKSYDLNKVNKKDIKERKEIENKIRKNDILPRFIRHGGHGSPEIANIPLMNMGDRAKIIGYEDIENFNTRCTVNNLKGQYFENKNILNLTIVPNEKVNNLNDIKYNLKMIFEDKDGNKYYQRIHGTGINMNIEIPEEIQ
ncbi:hypothetical protein JYU16_01095 [bacterium AH-315-M05]|nr:hypothetical protein [bacterium AH-315-M05]